MCKTVPFNHPELSTGLGEKIRFEAISRSLHKANGSVLDVGCGHGAFGKILEKSLEIFYFDKESAFLKKLKRRNRLVGDAAMLPFRDKVFDFVVSVDTLEHLASSKRESFIKELLRVAAQKVIFTFCQFHVANPRRAGVHIFESIHRLFNAPYPNWYKEHNEEDMPELTEVIDVVHRSNRIPCVRQYQGCFAILLLAFGWATVSLMAEVGKRNINSSTREYEDESSSSFSVFKLFWGFLTNCCYVILRVLDFPPYYSFAVTINLGKE